LGSANLGSANLRGADLSGANLSGANLSGAYLAGEKEKPQKILFGERPVLSVGPIGSRAGYAYAYLTNEGVFVRAGCFFDTLERFAAQVKEVHGDNEHGQEYAAFITMVETHARIWGPK